MTGGPVIFYSADLDVTDWAARHARGEVPDRWPYGLDQIPGATAAPGRDDSGWRLPERVLRKFDGRYDWRLRAPRDVPAACWDERTGVPVALSRRKAPVATGVLWLTDQPSTGPAARLTRLALDRCDALWVNSLAQLEPLRREWKQSDARTHHFPMGVDEQFWTPSPEGTGAPSDTVLVVGNDRDRDHPVAVQAVARAQRSRPALRLSLLTHQPIDVPSGLGERIAGVPHRELVQHYRDAAVVALAMRPNLHCSGTTAVLEAMACARPVVVTATPGMADYVRDGVTGILVPPGDDAAMAEAILTITSDHDAAERMGRAGRALVEERFTSRLLAGRIAALL